MNRLPRRVIFLSTVSLAIAGALAGFTLIACSSSSNGDGVTATDSGSGDVGSDSGLPVDTGTRDTGAVDTGAADTGPVDPFAGCTRDPGPGDAGIGSSDGGADPVGSADKFTLAQALAGFPSGTGVLTAVITTEKGQIVCTLDDTAAPITVANFVGLARGTRPWQSPSSGEWVTKPLYNGLKWHRVVANFVIQGGDPLGTGGGGPGYDLPKENQIPEPTGVLAMAASSVPSGSQFYIVIGDGPAASYNVFGTCDVGPVALAITQKDHMQKIEIARCPK